MGQGMAFLENLPFGAFTFFSANIGPSTWMTKTTWFIDMSPWRGTRIAFVVSPSG